MDKFTHDSANKTMVDLIFSNVAQIDKYSNSSDEIVYEATLDSKEASKINWDLDKTRVMMHVFRGIFRGIYINLIKKI